LRNRSSTGYTSNVTLLFSREHYLLAAEAYLRGIERRIEAGLDPNITAVASLFVRRWDVEVKQEVAPARHNRLGIAIAMRTYKAYRNLLASPAGASWLRPAPRRSGCCGPAPAPRTQPRPTPSPHSLKKPCRPSPTTAMWTRHCQPMGATPRGVMEEFWREGVDDTALAARLQREGADAFATSWHALLTRIEEKRQRAA
jgi:transaldolase